MKCVLTCLCNGIAGVPLFLYGQAQLVWNGLFHYVKPFPVLPNLSPGCQCLSRGIGLVNTLCRKLMYVHEGGLSEYWKVVLDVILSQE